MPDDNLDGIVDLPYNISGSAGAKNWYPLTSFPYVPEFSSGGVFVVTIVIVVFLGMAIRRTQRG